VSLTSAVGCVFLGAVDARHCWLACAVAKEVANRPTAIAMTPGLPCVGGLPPRQWAGGPRVGAEAPPTTAEVGYFPYRPTAERWRASATVSTADTAAPLAAHPTSLSAQAPCPQSSNPNTSTPNGGMVSDSEAGCPWAPMVSVRTLPPLPVLLPP